MAGDVILLDTAAWIWLAADPERLSPGATEVLQTDATRLVSAVSAWEVAMLTAKARIRLDRPVERWISEALTIERVEPVPLDHRAGVLAAMLPGDPPGDPADRMIVATALRRGASLVTPDRRLREYPFCPTVW